MKSKEGNVKKNLNHKFSFDQINNRNTEKYLTYAGFFKVFCLRSKLNSKGIVIANRFVQESTKRSFVEE